MKIEIIDLDFMNTGRVIASFLLLGEDGASAALVETGPTNCPDRLTAGLKDRGVSYGDVRQVYLTHIHLDHAGASGHLLGCCPTRLSTCTRSATRTLPSTTVDPGS